LTSTDDTLVNGVEDRVAMLKAYGLLEIMDILCFIHNNAAYSLLYLKGLRDSVNNGLVFAAGAGFSSLGTNYISMDNAAVSGSVNHADDDNSAFWYVSEGTDGFSTAGGFGFGVATSTSVNYLMSNTGSSQWTSVIQDNSANATMASDIVDRFCGHSMESSTAHHIQIDSETWTDTTVTPGSVNAGQNDDIYVCNINISGAPVTMGTNESVSCAWGMGGGLTSTQLTALRNALDTYMAAMGV